MMGLVKCRAESKCGSDASSFDQSNIPIKKGINEDMFCFQWQTGWLSCWMEKHKLEEVGVTPSRSHSDIGVS